MVNVTFAPSILSANFGYLIEEIETVDNLVNSIHVDVMDGHFVPNITIGPVVANSLKQSGRLEIPFSIHLMIEDPDKYGPKFKVDSEDMIIFHSETTDSPRQLIKLLRDQGCDVGISQKPSTPIEEIFPLLGLLDEVLVMGVKPGFGGQDFMPETLERIENLKQEVQRRSPETIISVDGGMSPSTVGPVVEAGADKIVAGSAIFGKEDKVKAIEDMKNAIDQS